MTAVKNREIVLYASAARTATPVAPEILTITNDDWCYATFFINTTAAGTSPTTVFTVQGVNHLGETWDILASAAVTGVAKTVLSVGPGMVVTANVSANTSLPVRFRLIATVVHLTGS
jgi:hypothetical protein